MVSKIVLAILSKTISLTIIFFFLAIDFFYARDIMRILKGRMDERKVLSTCYLGAEYRRIELTRRTFNLEK